jgi:hypothetical protein
MPDCGHVGSAGLRDSSLDAGELVRIEQISQCREQARPASGKDLASGQTYRNQHRPSLNRHDQPDHQGIPVVDGLTVATLIGWHHRMVGVVRWRGCLASLARQVEPQAARGNP